MAQAFELPSSIFPSSPVAAPAEGQMEESVAQVFNLPKDMFPSPAQADFSAPAAGQVSDLVSAGMQLGDSGRMRQVMEESALQGVSLDVADRNLSELQQARSDAARLAACHENALKIDADLPRTKEWYTENGAASVSATMEEMSGMGFFERTGKEASLADRMGWLQMEATQINLKRFYGTETPEDVERLKTVNGQLSIYSKMREDESFLTGAYRGMIQTLLPQMLSGQSHALKRAMQGGVGTAAATALLGPGAAATPLTAGAGAMAGYVAGNIEHAFVMSAAEAYGNLMDIASKNGQSIDPDLARLLAVAAAAPNAALEALSFGTWMKAMPVVGDLFSRFVTPKAAQAAKAVVDQAPSMLQAIGETGLKFLKAWGVEVSTEVAQEAVNVAAEEVGKAISGSGFEAATGQEFGERLLDTGIEAAKTFLFPALGGGIAGGAVHYRVQKAAAERAQADRTALQNLVQVSQQSKLIQEAPTVAEDFIENATGGQSVFISPKAASILFQTEEGQALAQRVGLTEQSVLDALENGADVAVPMSKAAVHLMPSEFWPNMEAETRLRAGDATQAEADALASGDIAAMTQSLSDFMGVIDAVNEDAVRRGNWEAWTENIRYQLREAGYKPEQADAVADIYAASAEYFAPQIGMEPGEFLAQSLAGVEQMTPAQFAEVSSSFRAGGPTLAGIQERNMQADMLRDSLKNSPVAETVWGMLDADAIRRERGQEAVNAIRKRYGSGIFAKKKKGQGVVGNDVLANMLRDKGFLPEGSLEDDMVSYLLGEGAEAGDSQALFQSVVKADAAAKARGAIIFRPEDGQALIALFKGKRDMSTILHETGHYWLENLRRVAQFEDAHPDTVSDWSAVAQAIGADVDPHAPISEEAHEKFARMVVEYFRQGKAPSRKLQRAFQRFARWLASIFKAVRRAVDLEELHPDVRNVLDRILASEQDIAEMQAALQEPEAAAPEGVKQKQWDRYRDLLKRAREDAEAAALLARLAEQKRVEQEARLEADILRTADKDQLLADDLRSRGCLNLNDIEAQFGEDVALDMQAKWGRGKNAIVKRTGKVMLDDLLADIGGEDIYQTLGWLINTPTRREFVEQVVKQRVAEWEENYSPVAEALATRSADAAMKARAEAMTGEVQLSTDAVVQAADNRAASMTLEALEWEYEALSAADKRHMAASRHLAAEIMADKEKEIAKHQAELDKAKQEVRDAKQTAKWMDAESRLVSDMRVSRVKEKMQQKLLEERKRRAALGAAYRARMEADRIKTQVRKLAAGKKTEPAFLMQIRAIAARFKGLGTPGMAVPEGTDSLRTFLTKWAQDRGMTAENETPALPPIADWLMDAMETRHTIQYRKLTLEQVRDIKAACRMLAHMSRGAQYLMGQMRQADINATIDELITPIQKQPEYRLLSDREKRSLWGKLLTLFRESNADKTIMRYLFKAADGYVSHGKSLETGPNERILQQPFNQAASEEMRLRKEYADMMKRILKPLTDKRDLVKPFAIPEVLLPAKVSHAWGGLWDMEKVFSVALNMGNQGNIDAVLAGYELVEEDLQAITKGLTAEHWLAVQQIWDMLETLYPRLNEVHEALYGVPLRKVDSLPFTVTTSDGQVLELRGGYYPLIFDRKFSAKAAENEDAEEALNSHEAIIRKPQTKSGMTKERTGGKLPPRLSLSVLGQHVQDSIHYATHTLPLYNTYALIKDERYKDAFERAFGEENYAEFLPWLRGIARPENKLRTSGDKIADWLTKRGTFAVLAFSLRTALMGIPSAVNSIRHVGAADFARGVASFCASPWESYRKVRALSPYMRDRATNMDRDIGRLIDQFQPGGNTFRMGPIVFDKTRYSQAAFAMITGIDALVTYPTWLAQFRRAEAAGKSMEEAVTLADAAVFESQAGGGVVDMSRVMREPGYMRLVTVFMTFASNQFNKQLYYYRGFRARMKGGANASDIDMKEAFSYVAIEIFAASFLTAFMFAALQKEELPEVKEVLDEMVGLVLSGYSFVRFAWSSFKFGSRSGGNITALRGLTSLGDALRQGAGLVSGDRKATWEAFMRSALNAAGFAVGAPTVQLSRFADGIEAYNKGEAGPMAILLGPPPKDRK